MPTFLLEIITPERIVFSDQAEMVTVPSQSGILGILPGHVPLFTNIVEGELKILKGGQEFFLAVGSGFLEVSPNKTVILLASAFQANEINEQEVIAAKKRAEEAIAAKPEGSALLEARSLFKNSEIAMKVLRRRKQLPN